jgi:hypothetical protein
VEREARGLVESLFSKELVMTQVVEQVRANRTISEPVRQKALALAEVYWKGEVHRQAFRLVQSLFAETGLKPKVIDSLRKDATIGEEVRQESLALAEHWRVDPFMLDQLTWTVIRKPGADAVAYRLALLQAEVACRLGGGGSLMTLGLAQYRVGQYQQAVDTLSQYEQQAVHGSIPSHLAILAMAHWRLGQKVEAQKYLNRLREAMKYPPWAQYDEVQAFLREAEALLQGAQESPQE